MRDIKFRAWNGKNIIGASSVRANGSLALRDGLSDKDLLVIPTPKYEIMQYTGLKDKNGSGLTEVYEGDIISIDGTLKGNIYENDKESTDIVIPQLGTKAWSNAYKEAVDRGYNYSE